MRTCTHWWERVLSNWKWFSLCSPIRNVLYNLQSVYKFDRSLATDVWGFQKNNLYILFLTIWGWMKWRKHIISYTMLDRYNFERLSNSMARAHPLSDFRAPLKEGYYPKLGSIAGNRTFPGRSDNVVLSVSMFVYLFF